MTAPVRPALLAAPAAALAATFTAALAALAGAAHAGPSDYVFSPIVEEGEREIDFKAGTARARDGARTNKESIGLGWGVNATWFTEVYAIWHKEPGARHGFDAWEWENKFQLTPTGKYPVDLGLIVEIERPKDRSEGYELVWGPLLQADLSADVQANANLLFSRHLRSEGSAAAALGYQWQLKYRWRPAVEIGAQGFGDLGPWRHWASSAAQSHVLGPAVFGKLRMEQGFTVKYNAALLLGTGGAAPRQTLRVQAELEF